MYLTTGTPSPVVAMKVNTFTDSRGMGEKLSQLFAFQLQKNAKTRYTALPRKSVKRLGPQSENTNFIQNVQEVF